MSLSNREHFVITTYTQEDQRIRTQVWDTASPLPIGHPFRWMIENTKDGLRIRNIVAPLNQVQKNLTQTIDPKKFESGEKITLTHVGKSKKEETLKLSIQPVSHLPAAFSESPITQAEKTEIKAYACVGQWIQDTHSFAADNTFTDEESFSIESSGDKLRITCLAQSLKLQVSGKPEYLKASESKEISREQLCEVSFSTPTGKTIRFNETPISEIPEEDEKTERFDPENLWFLKTLKISAASVVAILLLSFLIPKEVIEPKEKEVVPAQFAKVILSKPKAPAPAPADMAPSAQPKVAKAKNAAVVRAFRAKALQNAVSGLLKGGMTSLLAQSNIVSAKRSNQLSKSKTGKVFAAVMDPSMKDRRQVKLASLGGSAVKGAVGYKTGRNAAVSGQGSSFVALDVAGLAVENGLTKEEVGKVIHKHLSEVRYCYESAMVRNPDIQGKLLVDFTIGGNGRVRTSAVQKSTLPDPRLDDCILRRLARWKFPNPKGGVDVAVSYPFIFKTLGR